jgi:hypothetical protein
MNTRNNLHYKRILGFILSTILIIAACTPSLGSSSGTTPEKITRQTISPESTQVTTQVGSFQSTGCTVVSKQPTPNPTVESLIPPASEHDWMKGPNNAYVVVIEYGDFQ